MTDAPFQTTLGGPVRAPDEPDERRWAPVGTSLAHRRIDAHTLQLAGEVDLTNRDDWSGLIDELALEPAEITIDATRLTFIDAAGAWHLRRLVDRRPAGRTRIFCSPTVAAAVRIAAGDDTDPCISAGFLELDPS